MTGIDTGSAGGLISRPPGLPYLIAVGSYTESYGDFRAQGDGITVVRFSAAGKFEFADSACLPNPSYLAHSTAHDRLFATVETLDNRAAIVAIETPRQGHRMNIAGDVRITGRLPCHIDLHPMGTWIACACYDTGDVIVRGISPTGKIEPGTGDRVLRKGSGPHPVRQTKAHPHGAVFSPDGCWLLVPDLGADEVAAYLFDASAGMLGRALTWRAPPGSGPRTLAFSRYRHHIILVSELSSEVSLLEWNDGAIKECDRMSSRDPAELSKRTDNTASGLGLHPDGIHFGVTNRGDDSISIFRMHARDGSLERCLTFSSGGKKPRDFGFSPCGRWLLAANQDSDSCVLFEIRLLSVPIVRMMAKVVVRSPSSVCFLSDRQDWQHPGEAGASSDAAPHQDVSVGQPNEDP